jgi:hypothetical protein
MEFDNYIEINPPLEEKLDTLPEEERKLVTKYMEYLNESEVQKIIDKCVASYLLFKTEIKQYTYFTLALNWLIWETYKTEPEKAEVYNDIWMYFHDNASKNFKGKDLSYYYSIMD